MLNIVIRSLLLVVTVCMENTFWRSFIYLLWFYFPYPWPLHDVSGLNWLYIRTIVISSFLHGACVEIRVTIVKKIFLGVLMFRPVKCTSLIRNSFKLLKLSHFLLITQMIEHPVSILWEQTSSRSNFSQKKLIYSEQLQFDSEINFIRSTLTQPLTDQNQKRMLLTTKKDADWNGSNKCFFFFRFCCNIVTTALISTYITLYNIRIRCNFNM